MAGLRGAYVAVLAVVIAIVAGLVGYTLGKAPRQAKAYVAPIKIASLDPACTQIIASLGLLSDVNVIDIYSLALLKYLNASAPANATILKSIWPTPPVEVIVNASPSIICFDEGWYGLNALGGFSDLGIPLIIINGTADRNFNQIASDVASVANALHVPDRGAAVVDRMMNILSNIKDRVRGLGRPTVLFVGWVNPIWTDSNSSFIGYEIYVAGGVDPINSTEPYLTITTPQLLTLNADYIILSDFMGNCTATLGAFLQIPGVNMTKAYREGHIYVLGNLAASLVEEPGPLSVYGAELIAMIIHPSAFNIAEVPQCINASWVLTHVKPSITLGG